MKKASLIACWTVLAGFSAHTVSAHPVTVRVTGHVTQLTDYSGQISPYIALSQPVTVVYTYDTVEPVDPQSSNQYNPPGTQTSIVASIGPFTFQTGSSSQFHVWVSHQGKGGDGQLSIDAYSNNPPLSNGIAVNDIRIDFIDPSGQWPTSADPPDGAPSLASFAESQISVTGPPDANYYSIIVQVDSVALLGAAEVSPSAGTFLPQQHFDAAVLLPAASAPVATMQASVAGTPLPLNYPGTCQLAPTNNAARPALLCPGADAALTSLQGVTQIDWQVTLTDGSLLTNSVQWNLIR
jgi:hypothetical protein